MLHDFKKFLLRGNVVDLAVGVVIGAAFTTVVNAIVSDLLNPFISSVAHVPDFSGMVFQISGAEFKYGHLINAVISFILVAATVFFFVVKPMNLLIAKTHHEAPAEPSTKKCPQCLSEMDIKATRCPHCTQVIA